MEQMNRIPENCCLGAACLEDVRVYHCLAIEDGARGSSNDVLEPFSFPFSFEDHSGPLTLYWA